MAWALAALTLCSTAAAPADPQAPAGPTDAVINPASAEPPNIIVILTDDVGFAASSTFGGPIQTPTFDALAAEGLRYSNFHTAPMCSPTRAALLTGRNPHAVGMGSITETPSADAGYTSAIPRSAATVARVLRDHGYHTAVFGKYHLIPKWELSAVGPFDHWPTSMGFDYFYGFEPAMTDQFAPHLIENTRVLGPPADPDYFFERDIADRAIHWLREARATGANRPFFLYFSAAAAHAPVQAPAEWIAKFRGRFDRGWDVEREEILARQKRLGIAPATAELTPRANGVPAWSSLSDDERRVAARLMEAYAGMLAHADHQVGRVLDELRASGQYDNTLVFYVQGDNGTSPEGGVAGVLNYYDAVNAFASAATARDRVSALVEHLDDVGGPRSAPAIPTGWTNALNTPFPSWKTDAAALGSVRNGMVVSWPAGLRNRGGNRSQFHSVQDVVPTIYEVTQIDPPVLVDGVEQQPLDGVSMAYSFTDAAAPSRRRQQYFENAATVAMYKDGWWASYRTAPDEELKPDMQSRGTWQLFNLNTDFSQSRDVAADHPERLAELKRLFATEATRNNVFPIKRGRLLRPSRLPAMEAPGRYVLYPGTERYTDWGFPNVRRRSWKVAAHVDVPTDSGSGVIVNQGGRFGGWGLLMLDGVPTFVYRRGLDAASVLQLRGPSRLAPGRHVIEVDFALDAPDPRIPAGPAAFAQPHRATVTMRVDGVQVGEGRVPGAVKFAFMYQGAAIGHSTGSPLLEDHAGRFAFNGTIDRVEFELGPRP